MANSNLGSQRTIQQCRKIVAEIKKKLEKKKMGAAAFLDTQ